MVYFNTKKNVYLQKEKKVVILTPENVFLPTKPDNLFEILLFNHSDKSIFIDTNSTIDLMYSQFFAPQGKERIVLEKKRMLKLLYVKVDRKVGIWHILLN